jgi:hypothetical protein
LKKNKHRHKYINGIVGEGSETNKALLPWYIMHI